MGAQDIDLINRLKRLDGHNSHFLRARRFAAQAIKNTVFEKIANCDRKKYHDMKWGHMNAANQKSFSERLKRGEIIRNVDRDGVCRYGLRTRCVSDGIPS